MIPENRFTVPTIPGNLLNPYSPDILVSRILGPIAIQNPFAGLLYQLWQATAVDFDVLLEAPNTPSFIYYTHTSHITELSLAFDQNGNPHLSFVDISGDSFLWWFDPLIPGMRLTLLDSTVVTPKLTLDDARPFNIANSDIILGYVRAGVIRYRIQRERFEVEYTPPIGIAGPPAEAVELYHISMNSKLRLEFIYLDTSGLYAIADIMKKTIVTQKSPVEDLDITFDFLHTLMNGDYIVTSAVTITVHSGTDANPSAMLNGASTHTERDVTQSVQGGLTGNVYLISMSVRTFKNSVYVVEGFLYVNDSPAVTPP